MHVQSQTKCDFEGTYRITVFFTAPAKTDFTLSEIQIYTITS